MIYRRDGRGDTAAGGEIAHHGHPPRRAGGDQIVEDLVGGGLVEDSAIAELNQVILERLQLDALHVGHVGDTDDPEIGKACFRTERRELGARDRDLVVAIRPGVGKGFERRA